MKKEQQKPSARFPEENPNPVLSSGLDGLPQYINPAALRLCDDLKLKSIEKLLPDTHNELVKACLNTSMVLECEHKVDGHIFLWSYLPANSNNVVFIYGNDITKYRPEAVLESLNDTLIHLYEIKGSIKIKGSKPLLN